MRDVAVRAVKTVSWVYGLGIWLAGATIYRERATGKGADREGGSGQVLDTLSLRYLRAITQDMSDEHLDIWISVSGQRPRL